MYFAVHQALVRLSLIPIFPPRCFSWEKNNMTAKVFERRLTPNASEYKIFLMNLQIVFKNTDSYNLKLKSQGIMTLACCVLAVTSCWNYSENTFTPGL